ncbi:Tat pathway signal sequence domain protein [Arenivirga flava]|uniref:Tat pathway signal sequence domain protein n=1 Tax=Arenivirga flava TaxID=1930060 RepID=A0AA37X8U1_9MICO|nr:Tat pathway signal sequence domain protein [Arenivirga flava]GMA27869.1 hypothetical protein GCM10025874_11220 [Arenivirga flava]
MNENAELDAPLRWLDGEPPAWLPAGATWGLPLPRGTVADAAGLRLTDPSGAAVPAQFWPLATWPDGSLKWAGAAIGAGRPPAACSVVLADCRDEAEAAQPVAVDETPAGVVVRNGVIRIEIAAPGESDGALLRRVQRGSTTVAEHLRLVSSVQHELPELGGGQRHPYSSRLDRVTVEQRGPIRCVVRLDGVHRADDGVRTWLPFTVRVVLAAGSDRIRIVHSFVWDGDPQADFLTGLGVTVGVPLRAGLHDRHLRFAGDDGGFLAEAVRGVTGLRRDPGAGVRRAQVAGEATAPVEEWDARVAERLHLVPAWSDATLAQLSPDGYVITKRTGEGHAWVRAGAGRRSEGLVSLSDPEGGIGLGVRGFWQSYPAQLDVRGMATASATVTAWLHAPQAPPMDLRFYHDGLGQTDHAEQLEGLEITYEDYEPGFGDAHGIARTHELVLVAHAATPGLQRLALDVRDLHAPPLLQPTPQHLHAAGVFGDWAPVDRLEPARAEIEDSLDALLDFYLGQVEQRRWYGFWDYGDVMHSYDLDRHAWRYDVGGYAWDNSELSTDLWLWYSYLRSGRADVFRLAEAMTRHTGEVDVYHLGRWAGLGTRHGVQHWGCSAKQLRISSPIYRRIFHYLTADERVGDLLDELVDSDRTFLQLDPLRKVRDDAGRYRPDAAALSVSLGTDWGALAATWLTAWERSGDERSRDRLLGTMADIAAMPQGFLTGVGSYDLERGRFDRRRDDIAVSHLSAVFGLVEICSELIDLLDVPDFARAWERYCRLYTATPEEQAAELGAPLRGIHLEQAHSRLTAYVAARSDDDAAAARAWEAFEGGGEWLLHRSALQRRRVLPPDVLHPVDEIASVSTNDAAQYSLAAIQNLALIGDRLPPAAGQLPTA